VLRVENLERKLEAEVPVTLVDGVNLEIERGQFVAIMGPSGSGKSSLLYLLGLLDVPTQGRVWLDGEDTSTYREDELADRRLRKLGFVFQFHFLLAEFTVLDNVTLPMRRLGELEAERQIAHDKPASDQAVVLFKKFQAEEARVNEVEVFVKSKPSVPELILHIGRTLPKNIALDTVELRDGGLVLRVSVKGSDETAPGYATDFVAQLKADKVLSERFEAAEMTSIALNPSSGKWVAEIDNKLKGAKK
jgi:ABC-type sugar transport system ATPase subunit